MPDLRSTRELARKGVDEGGKKRCSNKKRRSKTAFGGAGKSKTRAKNYNS